MVAAAGKRGQELGETLGVEERELGWGLGETGEGGVERNTGAYVRRVTIPEGEGGNGVGSAGLLLGLPGTSR